MLLCFIKSEMASNYMTPHTRTLMIELKNQFNKFKARMNENIDSIIKRLENYSSSNSPKQQSTLMKQMASSTTIVKELPLVVEELYNNDKQQMEVPQGSISQNGSETEQPHKGVTMKLL